MLSFGGISNDSFRVRETRSGFSEVKPSRVERSAYYAGCYADQHKNNILDQINQSQSTLVDQINQSASTLADESIKSFKFHEFVR